MRIAANRLQATSLKAGTDNSKLDAFKADLRRRLDKSGPRDLKEGLHHFRQLAVSMFGQGVLAPKRPGETYRRLKLSNAQIRDLAEHPGKIRQHLERLQNAGRFPKDSARWSVSEAARLFSNAAKSVFPSMTRVSFVSFTAATVNDDFTDRTTDLDQVRANVLLAQEVKYTNVRKELPKNEFGVHQNLSDRGRAGSSVIWDKDRVQSIDRGLALGVHPRGRKMETRWITWTDVKIDGVKVRMASAHRPPKRFSALWPAFDRNLRAFVKNSKLPLIIGMDSNTRVHRGMERMTGLKWHGKPGHIDGFLVSRGIKVSNLHEGPKRHSDHHPVIAKFSVPKK